MIIYLASPYAHPSAAMRQLRFEAACKVASKLMDEGYVVFSPIAHSHSINQFNEGGMGSIRDLNFWLRQDIPLLQKANKVLILQLPNWDKSQGIAMEIEEASYQHIAVVLLDPSNYLTEAEIAALRA